MLDALPSMILDVAPIPSISISTPPSPHLETCVIIPARDEADRIVAALDALAHQITDEGGPFDLARYEVVLLANNCRDATAMVARRYAATHPDLALHVVDLTLPPDQAHIGWARRLLMDEACRRLERVGRPRGIVASTDADTRVAPDWLAATAREIARGTDAVGGRIGIDPAERAALERGTQLYQRRDTAYHSLVARYESWLDPDAADPWPRHYQHFGASIAVTAAAYRRAGGLPPVAPLEDMAFYRALRRVDARIRHSPIVRVTTSARSSGRTAIGLSTQLGEWTRMARGGQPYLVASAEALTARFTSRHCGKGGNSRG